MSYKPEISIILPFYNRASFLKETLGSILIQTYKDFEILIIDDNSSKEEYDEVNEHIINLNDNRIALFKKPQNIAKGANGSRNYGFHLANGKFIKWFDSDDIMSPEFLNSQIFQLKNNLDLDGVLANCGVYNDDFSIKIKDSWRKKIFSESPIRDYLRGQLAWQTGAGLWKISSLNAIDPFCQDISNAQEYIFHLFILTSNFKLKVIEKEMFKIRSHDNSISKNRTENYLMSRFKSRVIALSRLYNTGNSGKRFLLKSILKMYFNYGIKKSLVYYKIFHYNFNWNRVEKSKATLSKV